MGNKGKIIIILLFLLILAAGGVATWEYLELNKEKEFSSSLETKIVELENKKTQLEGALRKEKNNVQELEAQLQNLKLEGEKLAKSFDEITKERDTFAKQLASKEQTETDLSGKLTDKEGEITLIKKELTKLQEDYSKVKEELNKKNQVQTGEVQLDKIVVTPNEELEKQLEGDVLVVNNEHKFVVINLGKNEGVKMKDKFTVEHKGNNLGSIIVEDVLLDMAVLSFNPDELKDRIREGDRVVR